MDASSDNDFDGVADQTVSQYQQLMMIQLDLPVSQTGGSSTVTEGGSADLDSDDLDAQPTSNVVLSVV